MWGVELKRNSDITLSRQIYLNLRTMMLEGHLKPGEALPSTRELSRQLGISRNTVCEAYDMLLAEAFTESRQGAPTRVAEGLQLEQTTPALPKLDRSEPPQTAFRADFRTGQPDLRRFPQHLWLQLLHQSLAEIDLPQWGYSGPQGLLQLREEIAAWLLRSRGIKVHPQDIFITAGATQALNLLADLLSRDNQEILVEDPGHTGMIRALQGKGISIRPVLVDKYGLQTEHLDSHGAGAIYVTPSHQFPLGGILPAQRRAALVRQARKYEQYIIEDDYDSEFRYSGAPIAPLYSLDPERVIYVGTFSKTLFPALRIGYIILPHQLQAQWRYIRTHADVQNPLFEQAALAQYLHSRKFDRHVQQMRKLYGQRRAILLETLEEVEDKIWLSWGDSAGLHLALEFPGMSFDAVFAQQAREAGILVTPVEYHSLNKGLHKDKLLLGYGHLQAQEIRQGINILHDFMHSN
jgi:GntR family transcriptional regulator/MocR family aminotransferase